MSKNDTQPNAAERVTWDLRRLKAKEVAVFDKAARAGDVEAMAGWLATVIVECPMEWGAPTDPETYLNLAYYTDFTDLIEGVRNESGKLRAR